MNFKKKLEDIGYKKQSDIKKGNMFNDLAIAMHEWLYLIVSRAIDRCDAGYDMKDVDLILTNTINLIMNISQIEERSIKNTIMEKVFSAAFIALSTIRDEIMDSYGWERENDCFVW